ncbi:MAG: mechanosensitive ion channel family protein [Nanoarchaeota archaeon]|nr:mechanosensitive ion channel family protein [Nanoarchaeota archaeon]
MTKIYDILLISIFEFLEQNTMSEYLSAFTAFIITIFILYIIKLMTSKRVQTKLEKIGARNLEEKILKVVNSLGTPFYIILPLYISASYLKIPIILKKFIDPIFLIILIYYGIKLIQIFIEFFIQRMISIEQKKTPNFDGSMIILTGTFLKITLWIMGFLLFISNLGYNINALIAGLGVGGIAIAFALQSVLADVFASISIKIDKPFGKGDFIVIGDDMGIVDSIGIKSTRIKTLKGEELIISNKELTETRVHNYKRMERRRVLFTIGVTYQTSFNKVKETNELLKKIIEDIKDVDLDRVHFRDFGAYSLNFEVVYYINTNDYLKYMDKQEEINFKIKEEFDKRKIVIAFPTQTIEIMK